MTDQHNAKNRLAELLKSIGYEDNAIIEYHTEEVNPARSTLVVTFPHGLMLQGNGKANRKIEAEFIAAQEVLDQLGKHYPKLIVD